jgi:hypothetical protein
MNDASLTPWMHERMTRSMNRPDEGTRAEILIVMYRPRLRGD